MKVRGTLPFKPCSQPLKMVAHAPMYFSEYFSEIGFILRIVEQASVRPIKLTSGRSIKRTWTP